MSQQYKIPIYIKNANNSDYIENNNNVEELTAETLKEKIEEFLSKIEENDTQIEIAFIGGSFTALSQEKQEELLKCSKGYMQNGKVNTITISTEAEYINKDILKKLKEYKVQTIELVVKSSNNYILKRCGEKYTFENIKNTSKLIKRYGFNLGHQITIGLPDSTRIDDLNTARDIIKLKPKMIHICPLLVLKNTKLSEDYENGEYMPLSLQQAIERCKELYYFFSKKKIHNIHIGIQNAELITNQKENEILAGPYHEYFGQIVEDNIWYDSIVERIKKFNVKVKVVEIIVNPENAENIVGFESENVNKLNELYDVDIVLTQDEKITKGKFDIKVIKIWGD